MARHLGAVHPRPDDREIYKYEILSAHGERLPLKADPVGFAHQQPPETASVVHGLPDHDWRDGAWMTERARRQDRQAPISIYEVHLGSWRRGGDAEILDYDAMADLLVPYVQRWPLRMSNSCGG